MTSRKTRAGAENASPGPHRSASWMILLFPLLALVVSLTLGYVWNEDFYWYLSSGQAILENGGAIPDEDPFLYTADDGIGWVYHSWLWTVIIALLEGLGGMPAVALFHAALAVAITALVYTSARADRWGLVNALAVLLFLVTIRHRLSGKAEIATWLLFTVFFLLLDRHGFTWKRGAVLGALQVLWANLHGGYPLGVFLAACYGLGGWAQARFGKRVTSRAAAHPPPWFPVLMFVLSIADPRMFRERLAPFGFVLGSETVQPVGEAGGMLILEWRSPFSMFDVDPSFAVQLVVAAVFGFASFLLVRQRSWPRLLVLAGMTVLAAGAIRHLGGLALAAALVALANVAERRPSKRASAKGRRATAKGKRASERRQRSVPPWAHPVARALLATVVLAAAASLLIARPGFEAGPSGFAIVKPTVKPAMACPEAADFILEHDLPGPIFNDYQIGSYLGLRLHPRHRVFIDPRVLDPSVVVDYTKMVESPAAWKRAEEKYGFRTAVLGHYSRTVRSPLGQTLQQDPAWRLAYVDPLAVIYVKQASDAVPYRQRLRAGESDPRVPFTDPPGYVGPVAALQRLFINDYPANYLIEYLTNLGQLGKAAEVRELATEALASMADHALLYRQRCVAELVLGDVRAAVADCETAYALRPADGQVASAYVTVLQRAGRAREARSVLDEALRRDPDDRMLQALRRSMTGN